MITSFRSKALKRFWQDADMSGIHPDWRKKVKLLLSALDVAESPADLNLPGFGFHALSGDQAGRFALKVSANWRMTFGWEAPNAIDVDLEDYHGK